MMPEKLLVVGAGGQGKVVTDAVLHDPGNRFEIVIADENECKHGQTLLGHKIIAVEKKALKGMAAFHVAIGDNAARERMSEYLTAEGLANPVLIHVRACVAESALIGQGSFIAAQAVVGPDARIEKGCIINHGAVVDHDCHVGAFSHIAPGATLGGGVRIGRQVLIGAGANILPNVSIGDHCVIGAGAVVLNDLAAGGVYSGVPARKRK